MSLISTRILTYLDGRERATLEDISLECFCAISTARKLLRHARLNGQAHISGWLPNHNGGAPIQVWSAGPGESVAMPPRRQPDMSHRADWRTSKSASAILEHLECLGPATKRQLEIDCGLSDVTVHFVVTALRNAKIVHVDRWISAIGYGGSATMVLALGPGRDARRPQGETKAKNWKRMADKKRAMYGHDIAAKMLKSRRSGGAEVVVVDGKVVYRRRAAA